MIFNIVDIIVILCVVFAIGVFIGGLISYDNDKKYLQEIVQLQKDKELYYIAFEEVFSNLPEDIQKEYIKTIELDEKI